MKKSLIAIAALGVISSSAFAETQSADVNFDISVLASCTFDNFAGATKSATGVAGTSTIDLGTHELKRTCSNNMAYKMYVDNNTIDLTPGNATLSNGEILRVKAYVDQIGGDLVPTAAETTATNMVGTGAEQTEVIAFQVTNAAGGRFVNKHVNDSGKMTFTVEYTPQ